MLRYKQNKSWTFGKRRMRRDEAVCGSLPLVLVRRCLFPSNTQRRLVQSAPSTPFGSRGHNALVPALASFNADTGGFPGLQVSTFETPCSLVSEPVRPLARVKCVRTLSIKQKHLKNIERTRVVVVVQLVTTEKPKERVEHTKMCFMSFLLFCNFGGERSPSPPGRRHDGHVLKC